MPAGDSAPLLFIYCALFGFASGSNISLTPVCVDLTHHCVSPPPRPEQIYMRYNTKTRIFPRFQVLSQESPLQGRFSRVAVGSIGG